MRHYEDTAHIIRSLAHFPAIEQSVRALADEMFRDKDIAALPHTDEPSLLLADAERRADVERAFQRIAPMFWGERIPLNETCATILEWVRANFR